MISRIYSLFAVLVLFGFMAQAMIPSGFMPSIDDNNKISIVICSGDSFKTVEIDNPQNDDPTQSGADFSGCSFTLTSLFLFLCNDCVIGDDITYTQVSLLPLTSIFGSSQATSNTYSRAPPLFLI